MGGAQARPEPHSHPAGRAGQPPQAAEVRPCGGHQRQGQHRGHAGVLSAGGGLLRGAVHLAFHQPVQRAHPSGWRTDRRRRAGAAGGEDPARRRRDGGRPHRVRGHHSAGNALLCRKAVRHRGAGSGPRRHAGLHQCHRPAGVCGHHGAGNGSCQGAGPHHRRHRLGQGGHHQARQPGGELRRRARSRRRHCPRGSGAARPAAGRGLLQADRGGRRPRRGDLRF